MNPHIQKIKEGDNSKTEKSPYLFELPPIKEKEILIKPIRNPIWTENKAKLIEKYLYYFVLITHHGSYIDGFAGPQEPAKPDTWAANLVLETKPEWLKHFYLFELDRSKIKLLEELKERHVDRMIELHTGDFNKNIVTLLSSNVIKQKEATFCLLDQRTFECHWKSLKILAEYKQSGNKIELFYFFANSWLDRALAAQKDKQVLTDWWGRDDWGCLRTLKSNCRVAVLVDRFKKELGYKSVKPWPIYERKDGGHIMYYMIHATDHQDAPTLMRRAYEKAVVPKEPLSQINIEFDPVL